MAARPLFKFLLLCVVLLHITVTETREFSYETHNFTYEEAFGNDDYKYHHIDYMHKQACTCGDGSRGRIKSCWDKLDKSSRSWFLGQLEDHPYFYWYIDEGEPFLDWLAKVCCQRDYADKRPDPLKYDMLNDLISKANDEMAKASNADYGEDVIKGFENYKHCMEILINEANREICAGRGKNMGTLKFHYKVTSIHYCHNSRAY